MPGLVPQSESTVKLSESDKGANGNVHPPRPVHEVTDIKMEDVRNGDSHTNGERRLLNGNHVSDVSASLSQPHQQNSIPTGEVSRQLPPEIQHISSGYVSLSALIARLAQETFNELGNVVNDMAEIPVEQSRPNGVLNHVNHQVNGNVPGKSEANIQKKLRLLNFTNNWRPKFIKTLVLSHWARQAEAVSRVIDLKNWQDMQKMEYEGATTAMGELKRMLAPMKEPSPDTKTALEVLLLGKASWLPDFRYLGAESLSVQQLLNALRRINSILSIRLNLYETIPLMFRDFSISSGRATFRIPDEFEVDLSIADEDPTSQLYFIDFRFGFSPSVPGLPPGMLRSELEARANEELRQKGLQGLFDLLHNLVLTHKLSILRSQAYEMARGYWSEHLVVEPVRRSLVVQYWSNRPGGKNWIEIGLRRGNEKRTAYTDTPQRISSIGIRWFRNGREVQDCEVNIQLDELSMEHIVKQVIARHSSHIFDNIATKLSEGLLYASGALKVKHKASETEPVDASLLVQLTASTAIKVLQEPVSGRFAVQPTSQLNSRAEYELNRLVSPITEAPAQISYLRSLASVEDIETNARGIGWETAKSINPGKEVLQQHFPKNTLLTKFFRRHQWDSRWILAFTTSLEGDVWWLVELSDANSASKEPDPRAAPGRLINTACRILCKGSQSLVFSCSHEALTQVEWSAVGMISQHSDARDLSERRLRHTIAMSSTDNHTFMMGIDLPKPMSLLADQTSSSFGSQRNANIMEDHEIIGLQYRGIIPTTQAAVRVAIAPLDKPISNLKSMISSIPNLAIEDAPAQEMSIDGIPTNPKRACFKFKLVHRVGESSIPDLVRRLTAIEHLLEYISILESHKRVVKSASLTHIEFVYASIPRLLKATIDFPADAAMRLSFPSRNPHVRVQDHLTSLLQTQGLRSVISLLQITLPILSIFTTIEKLHKLNDIKILVRSETWYEVRYSAPIPTGGFDIRLRLRRDEPYWFIKESSIKKAEALSDEEEWTQSLRTVTRGKGKGWRGVKGGIYAQTNEGIGEALQKLDEVFRNAATHSPEESRPAKRKAENQIVEID